MKHPLIFGLMVVSGAALWLAFAQQALPPVVEQTVNCSATVPDQGQTGVAVQFQASAVVDPSGGQTAGSLYEADNIVGNLRFIPAGTFAQGSPASEACRGSDETQFTHTLTKNMAVMETEVTRAMWNSLRTVQGSLPADPSVTSRSSGLSDPVQSVTWYEAVLYANLLSQQQGLRQVYYADAGFSSPVTGSNFQNSNLYADWSASGYRLPTEGEWEYFARAATTGPFSVNEPGYNSSTCSSCSAGLLGALESVAWFCANAGGITHPAGSKAANPWGLRGVHGNVWEWIWDWYSSGYPSGSSADYRGPSSGSNRVIRGGGWYFLPWGVRSAYRLGNTPGIRHVGVGFRLLRSVN